MIQHLHKGEYPQQAISAILSMQSRYNYSQKCTCSSKLSHVRKNCMGQLGFTKKLCSDQHCCYPGTVCLLWQAKKMPVCPVHTTILKHLHHGIHRCRNVGEIKFIEMYHYVNLCNYSQASEP